MIIRAKPEALAPVRVVDLESAGSPEAHVAVALEFPDANDLEFE